MPDTEMGKTWSILPLIAGHARRDPAFRFTSLAHLLNVEFLRDCYYRLKKKAGVGIDQVSWEDYGRDSSSIWSTMRCRSHPSNTISTLGNLRGELN